MKSLKTEISFFKKISVRVTALILIILSLGLGITIVYHLNSQNAAIIESREKAIAEEGNILYTSIKNNMLAGEAPIAVNLFRELGRIEDIGGIKLYRANCVFWPKPATRSGINLPPILAESCHPFWSKPATLV